MTDLLTENARLRAALEAMLHRHILYCGGESMAFAGHTDVALFQEARAALATPAPDAVQEIVAEAVKAEREACARVCETLGALGGVTPNPRAEWKTHADNLAAAIRARGE
jgi:hypothetical protein